MEIRFTIKEKLIYIYYYIEGTYYQLTQKVFKMFKYKRSHYGKKHIMNIEEGRKQLISAVIANKPYMAGRLGTSECRTLVRYCERVGGGRRYNDKNYSEMSINAGFFPICEEMLDKWAALEIESCNSIDMFGVMNTKGEGFIVEQFLQDSALLMPANGIASASQGWTGCLKNKKVLVIHPMVETIVEQYKKRKYIFNENNSGNGYSLPEFELYTIKAVQTQADEEDNRFKDWFEALDYMTKEVEKIDFDVALIGCGAYGFSLAARIKKMGKVAIHMGGCLQTLFGIKGTRWDINTSTNKEYNEYWVYPSEKERPKGFEKVENGCYWKS